MIPIRLELTNFLAYRRPAPLDFTGIHVAVLTGENGAGKSSLLDAITWALWGRARAKTDAELVHQGQAEMRVEFTFALGAQVYRVIRAKRAGKSTGGVLDFQAQNEQEKWVTLSEATIPKTQAKITNTLKLNYDTFVNSAYLMQGKADEFTSKRPTDRKQVLADILSLQAWERSETRAKEKIKALDTQLAGIEAVLDEIEAELSHQAEYEADLAEAREKVIEVGERLRQAEAGWAQIDAARQAMVALTRQADDLGRRLADAQTELEHLAAEIESARAKANPHAIQHELRAAQARLADLEQLEVERENGLDGKQRMGELAAQLLEQNKAVEEQGNELKQRIELLQTEANRANRQLRATLADLEATTQKRFGEAEAEGERLARKRTAEVEMEVSKLAARAATLAEATTPTCPTCNQPLTDTQRAQLLADLDAEAAARRLHLAQELEEEARRRAAQRESLQAEAAARRQQLEGDLQADAETRRAQIAELETLVEARRNEYRANQALLKRQTDALAQMDKDLAQISQQLKDKPAAFKQVAEWQTALSQTGEALARLATLAERQVRWAATLAADQAQRAQLDTEAEQFNTLLRDAAAKQQALDRLRHEDTLAKARKGAAEQKLAALVAQAKQRETRQADRRRVAEARGLYEELRDAFGKKGVPAMLIEAAVPEIEAAANALLGRMTDGRMHVRFNMQKENQAGEVRETLDIQIADELGTRAYELYSGGEAFRVNFAVRVALSQLLARRAGTQLQTLIIDEGFGVLDASGREHLVEAINAAQKDFQRILVVTHIDELKDAFPARIEITKGPNGSEITLG